MTTARFFGLVVWVDENTSVNDIGVEKVWEVLCYEWEYYILGFPCGSQWVIETSNNSTITFVLLTMPITSWSIGVLDWYRRWMRIKAIKLKWWKVRAIELYSHFLKGYNRQIVVSNYIIFLDEDPLFSSFIMSTWLNNCPTSWSLEDHFVLLLHIKWVTIRYVL